MDTLHAWIGNEWLARAVLVVGSAALSWLLGWLLARLLITVVTRWVTPFDSERDRRFDEQVHRIKTPLSWFVSSLFAQGILTSSFGDHHRSGVSHAVLIASITTGCWIALRLLSVLEALATGRERADTADNLAARRLQTQVRGFRNIAGFLILLVGAAFILLTFERVRQLGAGILASAGVAGVILGFAAQRSISTIVAGVQIALSQPIRVDDVVIVEGEWGRIEEIRLTYVVVEIWDLRRLVVPISYFIERPFQNWTRTSAELLGTVELHLDYSVPVEEIRKKTKELLEASQYWDGKVCSVQVVSSNAQTMVVRPLFSAANSGDQWNLRCEIRERLIDFLQREYPHSLPRWRGQLESSAEGSERTTNTTGHDASP